MNTLRDQVWEILHDVYDPEIPLNIADLGLIYDLQVSDTGEVSILMHQNRDLACVRDLQIVDKPEIRDVERDLGVVHIV